jgi:hypothetical protein
MTATLEPERTQVLSALQRLANHPGLEQLLQNPKALKAFLGISFPSQMTDSESVPPDSQESAELATSELEAETSVMEFLAQLTKDQRTAVRTALKAIHPDCLLLLP